MGCDNNNYRDGGKPYYDIFRNISEVKRLIDLTSALRYSRPTRLSLRHLGAAVTAWMLFVDTGFKML